MILTKQIYNKINYKVILSLKFKINVLISSKSHNPYTTENMATHNRVEDNTSHNMWWRLRRWPRSYSLWSIATIASFIITFPYLFHNNSVI